MFTPGLIEFVIILVILAMLIGIPVVVVIVVLLVAGKQGRVPPRANMTSCTDCGQAISPRAETCPMCGAPQPRDVPPKAVSDAKDRAD